MSEEKSLSKLFQELGADPAQLGNFLENIGSYLISLSDQDKEQLMEISNPAPKGNYDGGSLVPGNFYLGADEGSTIYQLFSTKFAALTPSNATFTPDEDRAALVSIIHDEDSSSLSLNSKEPVTSVTAMKHFTTASPSGSQGDQEVVFANTFHDVTINTLNLDVSPWPKGKTVALNNRNTIQINNYSTTLFFSSGRGVSVQVGGDGVVPQQDAIISGGTDSSEGTLTVQLTKKSGYISIDAPGNYLTIPFGDSQPQSVMPDQGPIDAGVFYLQTNTSDNMGSYQVVYQLYTTTLAPLSNRPQLAPPHTNYSLASNRIPNRLPVVALEDNGDSITYVLNGVSANMSVVNRSTADLTAPFNVSRGTGIELPLDTYHDVELKNLRLTIANNPRANVINQDLCISQYDAENSTFTVSFTVTNLDVSDSEKTYVYIDGPYIEAKSFNITASPFIETITFKEYQGYITVMTYGSFHKINLPFPPQSTCG